MLRVLILVQCLILKLTKNYLSLILLPIVNLVLLNTFASAHYILYFSLLFFTLYFINLKKLFLSNKMLILLVSYTALLYMLFGAFEDALYDFYIDMNLEFQMSYISNEVCCILSLLHIFILYLLGYNRVKTI